MRFFLFMVFLLTFFSVAFATPEFAKQTGKDCIACHVNGNGGVLTKEGKSFLEQNIRPKGYLRIFRFTIYYIHLVFGTMWFGTILYVHLFLKPSYASKGLPKGELLLGWTSIIMMALTGTILTFFRISSFKELYTTHYGIVLTLKILAYIFMVITAFVVTFFLGPKMKKKIKTTPALKDKLTLKELEAFDGKEGRPAYIAYKGKVYDVTDSKLWKNGVHMGRHNAGVDLTDVLKLAPHKEDVIARFNEVAIVIAESEKKEEWFVRCFFALAYTNLVIVFFVIFLIALWKF